MSRLTRILAGLCVVVLLCASSSAEEKKAAKTKKKTDKKTEAKAAKAKKAPAPEAAKKVESSEPPSESKTEFFRDLLRKPKATIADAISATARYKGYNEPGGSNIDAELAYLAEQGVNFPPTVKNLADKVLDKGSATHLLMKALGIKGGVMYRLQPDSQRYALREAVDLKFMPATSVVSEQMSGADLLGLLVKCVEYRDKKGKTKKY